MSKTTTNPHPCVAFCHFKIKAKKPKNSDYPSEVRPLGDPLRAPRLDLDLTQRQASVEIGVDETTVNNCETNRALPAIRLIPDIVRFLGYVPYQTLKLLC